MRFRWRQVLSKERWQFKLRAEFYCHHGNVRRSAKGFHVLFFLDLYLSEEDESRFHPPPPFGLTELEDEVVPPERPYGKDELLGYLEHCRKKLETVMAGMTEAWVRNPCPFPYRDMSNGELLLYNMRHVQHHAAQLNMLLRQTTDSAPRWVSKGPQNIKV